MNYVIIAYFVFKFYMQGVIHIILNYCTFIHKYTRIYIKNELRCNIETACFVDRHQLFDESPI